MKYFYVKKQRKKAHWKLDSIQLMTKLGRGSMPMIYIYVDHWHGTPSYTHESVHFGSNWTCNRESNCV